VNPGPHCKVCRHPNRLDIELGIRENTLSYGMAASKYGLHKSTVLRHIKLHQDAPREPSIAEGTELERVDALLRKTHSFLKKLEADPEPSKRAVEGATKAAVSLIRTRGRLTGALRLHPRDHLRAALASAEFGHFIEQVTAALAPFPGALAAFKPVLEAFEAAAS
jgi:hypothetical protein